ncbi:hypothetical protein Plhal304r1_c047g0128721 [Plasmopara halstedii]
MLGAIATKAKVDTRALNRAVCRLLALLPILPKANLKYQKCLQLFHATGPADKMLRRLLRHRKAVPSNAVEALLALSAWDAVIHIMVPTVYHDPVKIMVLTDENPTYFSS